MLRARKAEDKAARRGAILSAAAELFETSGFAEVKMVDVAQAAGIAKGTVFLYFPSKEALFLELLKQHFEDWVDGLENDLRAASTPGDVARVFSRGLSKRETLVRLMLLSSSLQASVASDRIIEFHLWSLERIRRVGRCLENQLSETIEAGQGARLLLRMYAVFIGFRQIGSPRTRCETLEGQDMAEFQYDLESESELCMAALLRGFARGMA